MLLGVLFGQLTKRIPSSDGGLYAYARHEFGDFAGYLTAWCYWITAWAGNAAIVSSWVLYVESLFGIHNPSAWTNVGIAMCGLWIPAAVNLVGIRQMAWFQNFTVVLKFLPLLVVGVVGWFFVKAANFGPFNATGGSLYSAIGMAAGVASSPSSEWSARRSRPAGSRTLVATSAAPQCWEQRSADCSTSRLPRP